MIISDVYMISIDPISSAATISNTTNTSTTFISNNTTYALLPIGKKYTYNFKAPKDAATLFINKIDNSELYKKAIKEGYEYEITF
ncbi:hypothetical protein KKG31_07215 [Patescibacteria group bacterium]|nr:hypothetical protein [Patescibacteria group bacterium]